MKGQRSALLVGFSVFMVLLVIVLAVFLLWQKPWEQRAPNNSPTQDALVKTPETQIDEKREAVPGSLNGTVENWQAAPPCANTPLDVKAWKQRLSGEVDGAEVSYIQRASLLAPDGQAAAQSLIAAQADIEEMEAYQAMLLNVASGRLNRATRISVPELPEVHTVGDLLSQAGQPDPEMRSAAASYSPAVEKVISGEAIEQAICARLVVLQAGSPSGGVNWSSQGMQTPEEGGRQASISMLAAENPIQASLDFGMASPDGQWAAYTSLSLDAGGPIFLHNMQGGTWTNLIARMNSARVEGQTELNERDWWGGIDWLPDSRRLLIGRSDSSSVYLVDLETYAYQVFPFAGGGNGGNMFVDLAPDGSGFAYIGLDDNGNQVINSQTFGDDAAVTLLRQPMQAGILSFPRFSPDGSQIAYLNQQGDPATGLSYSIHLLSFGDSMGGTTKVLVEGNVGITVPMWSPDGKYVAYTRDASGAPDMAKPGEAPVVESTNIWVVLVDQGTQQQVTAVKGQARSPQWAPDGTTLAFVTQGGEIGMATLYQPGRMWLAAQTSPEYPLLTSMFFVP